MSGDYFRNPKIGGLCTLKKVARDQDFFHFDLCVNKV